jgi:hypothetical protein
VQLFGLRLSLLLTTVTVHSFGKRQVSYPSTTALSWAWLKRYLRVFLELHVEAISYQDKVSEMAQMENSLFPHF